jgi:hypothetical protein
VTETPSGSLSRETVERGLPEALLKAQTEYTCAAAEHKEAARARVRVALARFSKFVDGGGGGD